MPLKGDLGSIDLAHVFQMLTLNQKAGTLEIVAEGARAQVYFTAKGIICPHQSPPFRERVLRLLRRRLRLTEEQIGRARRVAPQHGGDPVKALLSLGIVPVEEHDCAVKEQMEEEIYELFFATDATFEFREGDLPEGSADLEEKYLLSGEHLIMEVARRIDEWGYVRNIIQDDGDIYEVVGKVEDVPKEERDSALIEVLKSVDGVRTVAGIVEVTHLTRYLVCRKLALLAEQGVIAEVPSDLLVERARACLEGERVRDAIRLFEKAIASGSTDTMVREMTGLAYQAVGEVGCAAAHFAELARACRECRDLKGEAELHLRIRELVPTEIESRGRLLEIYRDDPGLLAAFAYDAVGETIELAQIFRELSRLESAIKLVRDMVDSASANTPEALKLADLAIELGDPKTAVETLFRAGDRLLALRQRDAALRLFRRIKAIDPQHAGAIERLKGAADEEHDRWRRRRRMVLSSAIVLAGLILLAGYVEFSRRSWQAYDRITARGFVARSEFAAAIAAYDELRAAYPLTLWGFLAKERVNDLRADLERQEQLRTEQAELDLSARARRQADAEGLLAEARECMQRGRLEEALSLLRKANGTAADPSWAEQQGIDKEIASIELYLAQADALLRRGQSLRESGEIEEAHAVLASLLARFGAAPQARGLTLPIRIESDPSGARVRVGGELVLLPESSTRTPTGLLGVTPLVIDLPATRSVEVTCEKDGYARTTIPLDPLQKAVVTFHLPRIPDQTVRANLPVTLRLAVAHHRAASVGFDGSLRLVDLDAQTTLWATPRREGIEVTAGPLLDDESVWIGESDGSVASHDARTGQEAWRASLGVPLRGRLEWLGETLCAAGGARLFGFDRNGEKVMDVDLGVAIVRGPFAASAGAVVGLDDMRVAAVAVRGGELVWEQKLEFPISEMTLTPSGNVIVAGTRGILVHLDGATGERLWCYEGPGQAPVHLVAATRRTVVASSLGGAPVLVSLESGGTAVRLDEGVHARAVAGSADGSILVATQEGEVLLLDGESARARHVYALADKPTGVVAVDGESVFFGCEGGALCGIRPVNASAASD
ncbi:MAG: DUF4388 domain-containing protein [Planctomycetota bacterium]